MEGDDVSPYTIPAAAMASWMANPKYSRYLQHYEEVQRWMAEYTSSWKQCCNDSQAVLNQQQNSSYGSYGQQNWQPTMQPHTRYPGHLRHKKRKSLRSKRRAKRRYIDESHKNQSDATGHDDSYELEFSEEMKQFIATTQEFRRQRDKARKKGKLFTGEPVKTVKNRESTPIAGSPVDSDSMDIRVVNDAERSESEVTGSESESQEDDMTSAPKERPGVRRIAEMKELYGRHAAAIHGMETAIQLQFDRHYDRKRPALWPIVPLKM